MTKMQYIEHIGIQNHLFLHINQVNKKQPPRSRNSSEVALFGFIWVAGALSSTLLSVLGEFLLPRRSDEVVDIVSGNIIKIIRTASAIITKQNYFKEQVYAMSGSNSAVCSKPFLTLSTKCHSIKAVAF